MNRISSWVEKFLGRTYPEGSPCWNLVRDVYAEMLEIRLPSYSDVFNADDLALVESLFEKEKAETGWQLVVGQPREFDVLEMKVFAKPHVGVFVSPGFVLHTTNPGNEVKVVALGKGVAVRCVKGCYRHSRLMPS